jgi:hypothetical protein
MSKHPLNYYIGDPGPDFQVKKLKRGQDKHGQVHCLVWVYTYPKGEFFAKPDEYALGSSGSGIGRATTHEDARAQLHAYAKRRLSEKLKRAEDLVRRCTEALETLGDEPAMLERFAGEYKETER